MLGKIFVILSDAYMANLVEEPDGYAVINPENKVLINSSAIGDETILDAAGQLSSSGALNHGNFRIYMRSIEFENWKIIYASDTTQFYNDRKSLIQNVIISLAISLVLAMVFSNIISKRILYPLKKLIKLIQKYKTKKSGDTRFVPKRIGRVAAAQAFFVLYTDDFHSITIFMGSFLINSSKTVNSYIEDSYTEIFKKSSEELYEYLTSKRFSIITIANDSYVQKLFDDDGFKEVEPYVLDNLWNQAFMGMEEEWIGIYSTEGELLISNGFSYADPGSVSIFMENMGNLLSGIYMDVSSDQLGNEVLSLGTAVRRNTSDFLSYRYNMGYVKTDIRFDILERKMANIIDDTEAFVLIGKSGQVLYPGESANTYIDITEGLTVPGPPQAVETEDGKKLVFSDRHSSLDITLLGIIGYDSLFSQNGFMLDNYILITAIVLLLIFISSYFVSRKVLVPINKVNKIFSETSLDTMHENELDDYVINEINELGETYNSMIARIENLIDEVIVANTSKNLMEQEKKEAEIISLQAQINPHFLYNTLTTINGMIKSGYKNEAIEMVNALSDLFRYGISRGEIIIGIEEEIEHAKAYANIMSFRYKDRLVFEWDIDEAAYRYSTIKLIIQPFIENSINHGVKISDKICTIKIKCEVLEESLRITVTDDGMGIEARQLESIKNYLKLGSFSGRIGYTTCSPACFFTMAKITHEYRERVRQGHCGDRAHSQE